MSEKREKTEYTVEQAGSTYETGSTKPPKSYMGVILVLLGLVIFLGGIVTALGFTNLRLFRALADQPEAASSAVAFSDGDTPVAASQAQQTGLGFSGETVSEFWHTYHQLPRGIFIQSVEEGSQAARQGVLPGDILIRVNDEPIRSLEELQVLLEQLDSAQTVTIVVYRDETELTLPVAFAPGNE